ncbi:glycosyltransferase [Quatrionicoccus australiensis]|uniref:glycosyltransferase n=1 Tax=Quatrionicoccus australiensis TaxID=138118 RepID=UPI001CFA8D9A|nr:glycosyltransferase [Quatrionicoccus australiensis]MCB4358668.1 glycosyltransferase [Quatrionicoccus australiensis]
MNIVNIVEATATGTLSMVALLSASQCEKGHDVCVIYSKRPESPLNIKDVFDERVRLINIQMDGKLNKIYSIIKMAILLNRIGPDAVFLHSSFAGFLGRVAGLFCFGNARFYYVPHCISMMRQDISNLKRLFFSILEIFASIKKCDYVACSRSELSVIKKYIPFRLCHLLENSVNFPPVNVSNKIESNGVVKVITVGQIRKQKNPQLFSKLSEVMRDEDFNVEFIWVGDGDSEEKNSLLKSGVQVTGWVEREKVFDLLKNANIYLSTSLWEGMPVSIIEAQLMGLPVVASSCAGNIDVVEHGVTGFLFDSTDSAISCLVELIGNEEKFKSIAMEANVRARDRFGYDRYSSAAEKLLGSY